MSKEEIKMLVLEVLEEDKNPELIVEMANIRPKSTGLPMVIWVFPKTGKEKHGPRIKVQKEKGDKARNGEWVSVTISDNPILIAGELSDSYLVLVKEFIKLNKENLLKVWNDEIEPLDLKGKLIKV